MPEDHCGQEHTNADLDQTDEAELADAYAALEEDRRQRELLGATPADTDEPLRVPTASDPSVVVPDEGSVPNADDSAPTASASGEPAATEAPEQPRRRVFLIDGKGASC